MAAENTSFARRSLLFMPGDSLRKIEKAASWEVDTLIMDLEDGVAQNRKLEARATVAEALGKFQFGRRERLVRLNHISTGMVADEIAATVGGRPSGRLRRLHHAQGRDRAGPAHGGHHAQRRRARPGAAAAEPAPVCDDRDGAGA